VNFENYRKAYESYLLGDHFDPTTQDGKNVIASLHLVAEQSRENAPYPVPFDSPAIHLRALAVAYRSPGCVQYRSEEALREIHGVLDTLKTSYNTDTYGEQSNQANWWQVQVGNPLRILDTLVLLYDFLPDRDRTIREWTDIILYYQKAYSVKDQTRKETGANLMWKCHVYILLGILRSESELISWARNQLPGMLQYAGRITHPRAGSFYDDGFYPDGSFIQHYFIAYTGGYGKHFLSILAGLLYAFRDTDLCLLEPQTVDLLCQIVMNAYVPCMVDGRFLDIVRGREVSRWFYQDVICGRHVMRALCYLAYALPQEKTRELRALLKLWLSKGNNREQICVDESAFAEYYVHPSLPEVLTRLDGDPVGIAPTQRGHYNFGPMCKTVHHHGSWAAAISMYSKTTACYEYLNGESVKFWHMSDGVTYLYTADRDQYNGDYYATVDMQRLPGTTVDRSPDREHDPYYSWFMPESRNAYAFAGGASLGEHGVAGMQYCGQGKGKARDLEAKKAWFFLGDEIVCLGSGITSASGDPIETIVLNQRLTKGGQNLLATNDYTGPCYALESGKTAERLLHLSGNNGPDSDIGVILPGNEPVHLLFDHRKGSWNSTELVPGFVKENDYLTVWFAHGKFPKDARYGYILLPGASMKKTKEYAKAPDAELLACSNTVHAVRNNKTGLTGLLFWNETGGACEGISVDTQAAVLIKQTKEELQLAISDPTKENRIIKFKLDYAAKEAEVQDEGVQILSMSPLTLQVDTTGQDGKSLNVKVRLA